MNKSREQFEAWFRRFGSEDECTNMLQLNSYGTNYLHPHADLAWIAWQASRAAIEIELPPVMRIEEPAISFCAYGRAGVLSAIYEHGLNVKGDDSGETDVSHQR